MTARLPIPGGDRGIWDDVLNEYLLVSHNSNGTLKNAGVFNVKDAAYGAIGNGVTDDTVAIQAAFDACANAGGGTVYFPAGNFYVNTANDFDGTATSAIILDADNIRVEGAPGSRVTQGSTLGGGGSQPSVFGFNTVAANATAYQNIAGYDFDAVGEGAFAITLTSAADRTHFAVGDVVWLEGDNIASSVYNANINEVTAISVGGVLTLKYPIGKPFLDDSVRAVANVDAVTRRNLEFTGLDIYAKGSAILAQQYQNINLHDFRVVQTVAGHLWFFDNRNRNVRVTNIELLPTAELCGFQIADNSVDIVMSGCVISGVGTGINVGESCEQVSITDNFLYNNNLPASVQQPTLSMGGTTYNISVTGNHVIQAQSASGISTVDTNYGVTFGARNLTIIGNTFVTSGSGTIIKQSSLEGGIVIADNTFISDEAIPLHVFGNCTISGNRMVSTGAYTSAILVEGDDYDSINIVGNVSEGSTTTNGIYVANPGGVHTGVIKINGNSFPNATTEIVVQNETNSAGVDMGSDTFSTIEQILAGLSSYGIDPPTTNLCINGGFETNTTGWAQTSGVNTIARSTTVAKFGSASLKCTYAGSSDLPLVGFAFTLPSAGDYTYSCYVYIPTNWDNGSKVALTVLNYAGAVVAGSSPSLTLEADTLLRDQWQRLQVSFTADAGDLAGFLYVSITNAFPTSGRFVYVDGAQIEAWPFATSYVETDGGTASRT